MEKKTSSKRLVPSGANDVVAGCRRGCWVFTLFLGLICGAAALASGSVITIPINATVGVDSTLDLTGPGVPNLGFWNRPDSFGEFVYANGPSAGYELNGPITLLFTPAVTVLAPSDTVGPAGSFYFGTSNAFPLDFPVDQLSYLGFVNLANGSPQYGFITFELTSDGGQLITIDSVTYDNSGAAITVPTPEPGASSLLVSVPLVWWWVKKGSGIRRRKES